MTIAAKVVVVPKGAVNITLTKNTLCSTDPALTIYASPVFGVFSGPGVTDNGTGTASLDPKVGGLGLRTIRFIATNPLGGCKDTATTTVNVVKCASSIRDIIGVDQVRVFPNPTVDKVTIDIEALRAENVDIRIVSFNGSILETRNADLNNNSNILEFDLSNYAAGKYFIQITKNGEEVSIPVVKQ